MSKDEMEFSEEERAMTQSTEPIYAQLDVVLDPHGLTAQRGSVTVDGKLLPVTELVIITRPGQVDLLAIKIAMNRVNLTLADTEPLQFVPAK